MENFNKLVPIDGENGEKRTISSLQIAEMWEESLNILEE